MARNCTITKNQEMEKMKNEMKLMKKKMKALEATTRRLTHENEQLKRKVKSHERKNDDFENTAKTRKRKVEILEDNAEIASVSVLETWIQNPGLLMLPRQILSFLDTKSLANCRVVSKSFKDFIDSDRSLLAIQSNQALYHPFIFSSGDIENNDAQNPTLKAVVLYFQRNADSEALRKLLSSLKESVECLGVYACRLLKNYWSKRDHDLVQLLLRSPYIPTLAELHYACIERTGGFLPTILKFIIARKMDINKPIYGSPILHQVAQQSRKKGGAAKVQLLLEHAEELNLNIFATNIDGETALQVAERLGKSEIVALLEPFFQN